MATTTAISENAVHNAGGAVIYAGNIATGGPITQAVALGGVGACPHVLGSGDGNGLIFANSEGNWATMPARHYVVKAGNITTDLGGVSNTAMSLGSAPSRPINASDADAPVAYPSGWDGVDGKPYANATSVTSHYWYSIADVNSATGADQAAKPTRAVPGEFVYIVGKSPVYKDYPAKKG